MTSEPKPTRSFRIDPKLLDKAKDLNLDVTAIFESALAKAVADKRCPYCGQEIKKPKSSK